jgi:hypothetical protein
MKRRRKLRANGQELMAGFRVHGLWDIPGDLSRKVFVYWDTPGEGLPPKDGTDREHP